MSITSADLLLEMERTEHVVRPEMTLMQGFITYMNHAKQWLKPASQADQRKYVVAWSKCFDCSRVIDTLTIADLRGFQLKRRAQVGPAKVNQEVGMFRLVLKDAGLWGARFEERYRNLPVPAARKKLVGRALAAEKQDELLSILYLNKRWRQVMYPAALLSLNTGMNAGEIKGLHLEDINLDPADPYVSVVEGAKNHVRQRHVPLNAAAQEAITMLLDRYRSMMRKWKIKEHPSHYLLPARATQDGGPPDPNRHQFGWWKGWREACGLLGVPALRFHDLRHTAITAANSHARNSKSSVMALVGHSSFATNERYTHISLGDQRKVAVSIETSVPHLRRARPKQESTPQPPPETNPSPALPLDLNALAELVAEKLRASGGHLDQQSVTRAVEQLGPLKIQ